MSEKNYLGLDIGTDSVGWAVTDENYKLRRFHGEPMWGSVLFEAGNLKAERRAFRISRRRLKRRQQRVLLIQELFASEIAKTDPGFYKRLRASALYRDDAGEQFSLFNDPNYTDKDYYEQYPTVHHLIYELMQSTKPHDVRLVYLACTWLVAHRGHFLNEVSKENIAELTDFELVYQNLEEYLYALSEEYAFPWPKEKNACFRDILPKHISVSRKFEELKKLLFDDGKCPKKATETFPYNCEVFLKALCGSRSAAKDLFINESLSEIDSFTLGSDDELLSGIMMELGENGELISRLKGIYDWSLLVDILAGNQSISESKILVYEQHKQDLKTLKYLVKKYIPLKFDEVFRDAVPDNYVAYSKHYKRRIALSDKYKWSNKEKFSKYLSTILKLLETVVTEEDKSLYIDVRERVSLEMFLPKQKDTNNRVIPYQLYWNELKQILDNASAYLPFLKETDENGLSTADKILSVFSFRIPYFVGPLNPHSTHGWIVRKSEEKVYPWNFEQIVDLDASENEFINRMVNTCTYLAGENCVPKESLLYRKYMVLNEINNIRINGVKIPVELKQAIYLDLFCKYRKVTRKRIEDYLFARGELQHGDDLSGIDIQINANLKSYHDFRKLLEKQVLTEKQVEEIIERSTYSEDSTRFREWVKGSYPKLSEEDVRYVSKLHYKDFGRLSNKFLNGLVGVNPDGGELCSIMKMMWETNHNLMELLSDNYTFAILIEEHNRQYYAENPETLEKRLERMYVSNAVKRPILRTMEVVKEVTKALGKAPDKIFIEMARGASENQRNKRTQTRKNQILELYKKVDEQDVRELKKQLETMGEMVDNRLQSDKLFLYFMQLGRSVYSGKPIDIEQLGSKLYDIDHIYPQRLVKDDSVLNNKVLCFSNENGSKKDVYPVPEAWRKQQRGFWEYLTKAGLMTPEKFKRLTRETGFSDDEKMGFINRQLTETSQSTKAIATILKEKYPGTEIIYVKARLTSEFRQYIEVYKSRSFNELHHAKDAYLNIVTGNVYDMKFSKKWFSLEQEYSLNMKAVFGDKKWVARNGEIVWGGSPMLGEIKKTVAKNNAHLTQYAFCRHGGFFDQMPVKKGDNYIPRKNDLPTSKYGGYNKATASYFMLVKYKAGKENDIIIMPVELLYAERVEKDAGFAEEYTKQQISLIRNKKVEEVLFPLGMRKLKINTVFSLDGYRVFLCSKSGGGKTLVMSGSMPLSASMFWHVNHLDNFAQKCENNRLIRYDPWFDKISKEKNTELYELLTKKFSNSIFKKRINHPQKTLQKGYSTFLNLEIIDQTKVLQSILLLFGRTSGGINLVDIGGEKQGSSTKISSCLSTWKKSYSDVRVIDLSVTGLWERSSDNLLNLL